MLLGQYIAVQSLKAFHVEDVPYLLNGFVVPKDNAATYDRGATVVTGENGKELLYDSNTMMPTTEGDRTEYTSHKIGDNGMILLRFGQPYYIESIRLLLCEKNNRTYRFYVETSVDENNWEMAVDMRNTDVNSSLKSVFSFNKRLVLWMKIVGTECSIKDEKVYILLLPGTGIKLFFHAGISLHSLYVTSISVHQILDN